MTEGLLALSLRHVPLDGGAGQRTGQDGGATRSSAPPRPSWHGGVTANGTWPRKYSGVPSVTSHSTRGRGEWGITEGYFVLPPGHALLDESLSSTRDVATELLEPPPPHLIRHRPSSERDAAAESLALPLPPRPTRRGIGRRTGQDGETTRASPPSRPTRHEARQPTGQDGGVTRTFSPPGPLDGGPARERDRTAKLVAIPLRRVSLGTGAGRDIGMSAQ